MSYQVFSTGHAGSTWLSSVLHHPVSDAPAFHEPMTMLLPPEFRQRHAFEDFSEPATAARLLENFRPYLEWKRRREQRHTAFGEVHAFGWWIWPHLREHLAPTRCLVVRNGIQVMHSMSRTLALWAFPERTFANVLREDAPRSGSEQERFFELVCAMWAGQEALLEPLAPLPVHRLEDLLSDEASLRRFVAGLTGIELPAAAIARLQASDRNRKIEGDRSPANLFWNVWTEPERRIFSARCSEAMARHGYAIPRQADAPPQEDGAPQHPPPPPSRIPDAFNQLWALWTDPAPGPIVIVGRNDEGRAAAGILSQQIPNPVCFADAQVTRGESFAGFPVLPLAEVAATAPSAFYVATLDDVETIRAAIARVAPDAEIYGLFSGDSRMDGVLHDRSHIAGTGVERFGPLALGDALADGWRIERIDVLPRKVCIAIGDAGGGSVTLEMSDPEGAAHSGPFDVRGGFVSYRKTDVAFDRFAPAARSLSSRIAGDAPHESLAESLARWRASA